MRLKDIGWVWEGQAFDPGVDPSMFGVGEGCEYFGLSRAWYMFHPNTELAMNKLSGLDEVVCDISKWHFFRTPDGGVTQDCDSRFQTVRSEAALVSELSCRFPNITGAVHDDLLVLSKGPDFAPERYGEVYAALKSANPALRLWTVVYTDELEPEEWAGLRPFMDVVSLWVRRAENMPHLDEYIDRCREVFPDKTLIMGCRLRDYPVRAALPMDMLKVQCECLGRCVEDGTVDGYSILGALLIDSHQEQANWVRDFIAANS